MGEIVELMEEGVLCESCGGLAIGEDEEAPGHWQFCDDCKKENEEGV